MEKEDIKIPLAMYVAYWPGNPVYVCERHKNMIKNVAYHMGFSVAVNAMENLYTLVLIVRMNISQFKRKYLKRNPNPLHYE